MGNAREAITDENRKCQIKKWEIEKTGEDRHCQRIYRHTRPYEKGGATPAARSSMIRRCTNIRAEWQYQMRMLYSVNQIIIARLLVPN